MSAVKNLARRIALVLKGIYLFKDWGLWLLQRFGLLRKKGGVITFRLRNGIRFKIDASRNNVGTLQEVWLMDLYEKSYKVQRGDVVIDIGASFGAFSVLAASKGAKVYAYEPTPRSFKLLKENTSGYDVIAHNLAVAGKEGQITIYEAVGGDGGNSAIFSSSMKPGGFTAETTTIPKIMEEAGYCNLLKIDCEGCETDILRGAGKELFAKIENIAMEYHCNLSEVAEMLGDAGYKISTTGGKYGYLYASRQKFLA